MNAAIFSTEISLRKHSTIYSGLRRSASRLRISFAVLRKHSTTYSGLRPPLAAIFGDIFTPKAFHDIQWIKTHDLLSLQGHSPLRKHSTTYSGLRLIHPESMCTPLWTPKAFHDIQWIKTEETFFQFQGFSLRKHSTTYSGLRHPSRSCKCQADCSESIPRHTVD